jgi:type IX secretion system PorP/SprF family membrane protein
MLKRSFLRLFFAVSLVVPASLLHAQDPQFTQFYASPIYLNPAFAGSVRCARINMNSRLQWQGISGNYITHAASYDQHFDALQGGIGIRMMRDEAGIGTITSHNVGVSYSYLIPVNRKISLRIGAEVGIWQRSLNTSKLTFGDQIDDRYGFIYDTQENFDNDERLFVDFGAGAVLYNQIFYGGVAVHHITQPNEGFLGSSRLPFKLTTHFGAMIPLRKKTRYSGSAFISPNILFQLQQSFYQLNVGLYAGKGPIVGGLWYRNNDSFIGLVGIQRDSWRIGYSYDITISRLTNATAGSHEFSLGFTLPCKRPRKRFRTVNCPSF